MNQFRLLPIVVVFVGALLVLKLIGIVTQGGYVLGTDNVQAQEKTAEEKKKDAKAADPAKKDAEKAKADAKKDDKKADAQKTADGGKDGKKKDDKIISVDETFNVSRSKKALQEQLGQRRAKLDRREAELDAREALLRVTEKRIQAYKAELERMKKQIDKSIRRKEQRKSESLKGLITMYESMKPKEAAKIFDRLDMDILMDVANRLAPRKMASILAKMDPAAAQRLTVAIARAGTEKEGAEKSQILPKIQGK